MKYSFFLIALIACLVSAGSVFANNTALETNLGYLFYYPNANHNCDFEPFVGSFNIGIDLLHGRRFQYGFALNYFQNRETELILTGEDGPEALGTYTPKIKNQFYAFSFKYVVMEQPIFSTYFKTRLGLLKRSYDVLSGFDEIHQDIQINDENRFAYSLIVGAEIPFKSSFKFLVDMNYFRTTKFPDKEWQSTFNAAQSHLTINAGIGYAF